MFQEKTVKALLTKINNIYCFPLIPTPANSWGSGSWSCYLICLVPFSRSWTPTSHGLRRPEWAPHIPPAAWHKRPNLLPTVLTFLNPAHICPLWHSAVWAVLPHHCDPKEAVALQLHIRALMPFLCSVWTWFRAPSQAHFHEELWDLPEYCWWVMFKILWQINCWRHFPKC